MSFRLKSASACFGPQNSDEGSGFPMSMPLTQIQISDNSVWGASGRPPQSNLLRPVYCVLGIPIDAIDLTAVVEKIESANADRTVLRISTPNLNFLVSSLSDAEFKQSLLDSELCPPDGIPIIWIARLLGLPIKERAPGADLLERLNARGLGAHKLRLFLFGGAEGIADTAAGKLNAERGCLTCVGAMNPGFGDIGELSQDRMIDAINSSRADFLVVSLGAKKGQLWLQRNHNRLTIPIRSHLGAAMNFQAGTIKRAPRLVRAWGFEWLWRTKEERYLWKRYRDDGFVFLRLLFTRILPLALMSWRARRNISRSSFSIRKSQDDRAITLTLSGSASEEHVSTAVPVFEEALTDNKDIVIDLSNAIQIDCRFLGLLLMLRKELGDRGKELIFTAVPPAIGRMFYLSELSSLLSGN
jgi:N-acetylglucosaminyldiphosphoundecaprenol N-acetyl-beta-D-mannosaminyltransferase